jgi:hypothetical protein
MEQNKKYKTPDKSSEKNEIKIKITDIYSSTIEILREISKNLFKYILDILPSNSSAEKKEKIETYFNKILMLLKKLTSDRNKTISKYDSLLRLSEEKIRLLYSALFNMKIKNNFLENNIDILLKKEKEYRLVKEKTGILVENGVIIHNDRKEHEIFILRVENSNLKNVINKKDEELKELKEKSIKENKEFIQKIQELKYKNDQLKIKIKRKNNKSRGHSCSSININNIDITDSNISNINGNNNDKNIKNIINPIKRPINSNLLNNKKYISLIHCQSMGHLNLNAIIKNNKVKSKSKNKTNNNINNISKNNNNNQNLILGNINMSPIRHKKKLYFTPHSHNETDNKINFQPLKKSKSKNTNNNSKTKKNKNNKSSNTLKSMNNDSKSKIVNKNFEKEFIHKKLITELNWSQNISMNNSGIPKSMSKINKSKINNKRSNSKKLYKEKQNNKNSSLIMNISGKENIPVNKTCLSSIIRKNTINTSNNSFYNKIF